MINFDRMMRDLGGIGKNLYHFSIYTPEWGILTHRFQPCNRCNNSYSVAKAFVMTAIGLLQDDGLIEITDSLYAIFAKDFPKDMDPGWKLATIEHALTHRLGFDGLFLDTDVDDLSAYPTDDYLQMVLSHPLAYLPGTHNQYTDAAFYLLSRLVSHVSGEKVDSLLWRRIMLPMRFVEAAWSRCPHEYPIGATGLYICTEDMVKLGMLYLDGGVYDGQRLISEEWVRQAIAREYEFHVMTPNGLIGKGGMYGQGLVFSREKQFAAAWQSYDTSGSSEQIINYLDQLG